MVIERVVVYPLSVNGKSRAMPMKSVIDALAGIIHRFSLGSGETIRPDCATRKRVPPTPKWLPIQPFSWAEGRATQMTDGRN